jgi:mannose-1-phosphate guanylyltransferase
MIKNTHLIIMAGGIGSRLWPLSTKENPKQFIDLLGAGRTILQQTYDRFINFVPHENIYVVTNT